MKKFYRCRICGSEFCLKGRKYCEEGGTVFCEGQPIGNDQPAIKHEKIDMTYAGKTIEDLRALRQKQRQEVEKCETQEQ